MTEEIKEKRRVAERAVKEFMELLEELELPGNERVKFELEPKIAKAKEVFLEKLARLKTDIEGKRSNITMSLEMFDRLINSLGCSHCQLSSTECIEMEDCKGSWIRAIKKDNKEKGIIE